ncbi:LOW QUALITY PROTEIN: F-box/LRR-repeat protein 5 [Bombina bombina]|uniref:LOW QUALITY PROTEIN: F-box/LRR-repeat protein 5 n=1 Tax=Bombina bombina TaxID=8345 RepID=UPI00235A4D75|nr:LOW QUALITY PROTEIN: F-box/LRR-repeat protein 5 [Bombina bombina]
MAPFPDEVDVFTAPHWRMKQLVGRYSEKLSKTNFSNNNELPCFNCNPLYETFNEFKMHEQIENEYIIGLLQQRSQTVYNVHSDNKLSEMLVLFEKAMKNIKNEYEQLNYAKQLKERLEAFTSDFLPHMKEEEEVFQPMLMEYFTYDELKDIKKTVIAQHCSQKDPVELLKGLSLLNRADELQKVLKYSVDEKADKETKVQPPGTPISQLPPEVMLNIFSYLNPQDLCRCSQVNTKWAQLAKTGSLWKHIYPVFWARGNWYNGPPTHLDTEPDEDWVSSRKDESRAFQEWDEDADIDESENAEVQSSSISVAQREKVLLHGLVHNILPYVGHSVKTLVLAYSSAVSNKMIRHMLAFCPNLEHLDLTQTDITDSAFDGWSYGDSQCLRRIDLSGCDKLTDLTLERMSKALNVLSYCKRSFFKCCRNNKNLKSWTSKDINNTVQCNGLCGFFSEEQWMNPNIIWLLDSEDLADIEDAAEWKYKYTDCVYGLPPSLNSLSSGCCSKGKPAMRTSFSWQKHCRAPAFTYCGHSFCSTGTKLRTIQALPGSSSLRSMRKTPQFFSGSAKYEQSTRVLQFLSLSGCHQITDHGLRALTLGGGLPYLEHLNLSGCLIVTGSGLQDLVAACPSLNDEHFYYCDNINGPHADTASGCQNLQCGFRVCCRSGE